MAENTVVAEVKIDFGEAKQKVSDLKEELKSANGELKKAEKEFGFWGDQAVKAAGRVGEIEDQLKIAKDVLKSFAVEGAAALESFDNAAHALIGGFGALSGIMGMFGEKSETVEAAVEKVKSVLEMQEAIESIQKVGEGFKKFGGILGEIATKGFGSIKTAIAETGLGLLVIGLGLVISKLIDWISGSEEAKEAQDNLKKSTDSVNETLKEYQSEISNSSRLALSRAKAAGASEQQIFETAQFYAKQNNAVLVEAIQKKEENVKKFEEFRKRDRDSEKAYQEAIKDIKNTRIELEKSSTDIEIAENERKEKNRQEAIAKQKQDEQNWEQRQKDRLNKEKKFADDELKIKLDGFKNKENIEIATARLQGASDEDIFEIQKTSREKNIKELNKYLDKVKGIKGIDSATIIQANQAVADAQNEADVAAIEDRIRLAAKKAEVEKDATNELNKISEENIAAQLKAQDKYGRLLIEHEFDLQRTRINNLAILDEEKQKLIDQYEAKAKADLDKADAQELSDNEKKKKETAVQIEEIDDMRKGDYQRQADKLQKWYNDKKKLTVGDKEEDKKLDKLYAQQKLDMQLGLASNLLGQAANLFGKQTVAGKTFAIAQATIDTYKAANSAYASMAGIPIIGPALGGVAAGLAVASGIKNIKSILATKVEGASDNTSAPSIGSGASIPAAPLTPMVQQTNTSLNQDQLNQIGNATVRAFVLESDVSNNQEKTTRLNRAARLGG